MRWCALVVLAAAIGGCGDEDDTDDTDDTQEGCGEPVVHASMALTGRVVDAQGNGLEGVEVRLEERTWEPGTVHGTGTSDATGAVSFTATDLVEIPRCWGTHVGYYVAAESGELAGEKPMNQKLSNAVGDGSFAADFTDVPLTLE